MNKNTDELISLVRKWAVERNLHSAAPTVQLVKLLEEAGELARAHRNGDRPGVIDGVGDATVVLIVFCQQYGISFNECLESAYNVIRERTGTIVDGMFIKDEDLKGKQQ